MQPHARCLQGLFQRKRYTRAGEESPEREEYEHLPGGQSTGGAVLPQPCRELRGVQRVCLS